MGSGEGVSLEVMSLRQPRQLSGTVNTHRDANIVIIEVADDLWRKQGAIGRYAEIDGFPESGCLFPPIRHGRLHHLEVQERLTPKEGERDLVMAA